jgi:hypothetical protein
MNTAADFFAAVSRSENSGQTPGPQQRATGHLAAIIHAWSRGVAEKLAS